MALPPLHRVDHVPQIILSFDTAWDQAKLDAEYAEIVDPERESDWKRTIDHPWYRYVMGEMRGDLSPVRQYLLTDPPGPYIFELRRLTLRELAAIEARQTTNDGAARNLALSYAMVSVEGTALKFDRAGREPPHALTDADMQKLRELVGDAGIKELGEQAIACSRELLVSEKKP